MRIFSFAPDTGRHVDRHGSDFVMSRLAHVEGLHVGCMHLGAGGVVGHHRASTFQLFIVVDGDGWVEDEQRRHTPIATGEAAFWQPGQLHGAGTDRGMTAIVVEGDLLGGNLDRIGPVT